MASINQPSKFSDSKHAATQDTAAATTTIGGVSIGRLKSYNLLEESGNGAFGVVTKAQHRSTGEAVAIKTVRHGRKALLREASLLAACSGNPHVVGFREVARGRGLMKGQLHLVMEFVGPSLHDVLCKRRGQPFMEAEARGMMRRLLGGAEKMHARGVIHCDLKPGNVLIGENDGQVKVCDFGLARFAASPPPDTTTQLLGTLCYMAPELLHGMKNFDASVDMWSLGCVMAELVTGKPLFKAKETENGCQQLVSIVNLLGIPDVLSEMELGVSESSRSQLREKVPEEKLSQEGFDVLCGLLEYNPKERLTAANALQKPWFAVKDDDATFPAGCSSGGSVQ
ncbi:hypothetical protein BS78_10G141800 [Paspalum vaginatum]|nr:hypothetical protein BS78_10G141800 [Paspalum vaginatum]